MRCRAARSAGRERGGGKPAIYPLEGIDVDLAASVEDQRGIMSPGIGVRGVLKNKAQNIIWGRTVRGGALELTDF